MKSSFNTVFLLLTAHLGVFSALDALFSWHIFLKKDVLLSDSVVRVKDVGNIYGMDLTSLQRSEIEQTILAESPLGDVKWDVSHVRSLLEKQRIYPESLRGTDIELRIDGRTYTPGELAEQIQAAYPAGLGDEFKVEVKKEIVLAQNMAFLFKVDGQKTPGEKIATIVFRGPSGNERYIKLPYTLLKSYTMIMAQADLDYGQRLTVDNVAKKTLWLDHPVDNIFLEMPLGYATTRKIDKGSMIFSTDAVKKIDVRAGDTVTVEYKSRNLLIEATLRAAESGSIGQVIKFRSHKNKIVYGEILSKGRAGFVNQIP